MPLPTRSPACRRRRGLAAGTDAAAPRATAGAGAAALCDAGLCCGAKRGAGRGGRGAGDLGGAGVSRGSHLCVHAIRKGWQVVLG